MVSGRESLFGNKEGRKSQGKEGSSRKKQLKEVVIKCEAGGFRGVFQLWRKSGPWTVGRQCSGAVFHCVSLGKGITPA